MLLLNRFIEVCYVFLHCSSLDCVCDKHIITIIDFGKLIFSKRDEGYNITAVRNNGDIVAKIFPVSEKDIKSVFQVSTSGDIDKIMKVMGTVLYYPLKFILKNKEKEE